MRKTKINRSFFLIIISIIIGFIFGFIFANEKRTVEEISPHLLFTCHLDTTDYLMVDSFSMEECELMPNPPMLVDMTPQNCEMGYVRTPETAALIALSQCRNLYLNINGEHFMSHFNVYLCDSTWFVGQGFSGPGMVFGGFNVEIDKKTGEICGFERFK